MERGPNDLEERIEMLEKQKKFMQNKLRQAGAMIKDLEEMNGESKTRIKRLEKLLQEYEDKNVC